MAYVASSLAVRSLNTDCISQHNGHLSPYSALKLPRQKFHGNLQDKIRFLLPSKIPANSFIGQIGYPLRKKASLVVSAGWSLGDQNIDSPNERPPYDSYRDSNTGDLVPARGARPSIPDKDFWSEDTMRTKPGQAPLVSSKSVSTSKPSYGQNPGSRRKKSRGHAAIPETSAGETGDDKFTPEPSNYSSEEEVEETSTAQVIQEPKTDEEIFAAYELARKYGEPHSFVPPTKKKTSPPLLNEELWWNWRKAPKGMERWTEWKKITPSSEAAMAMAMAETGQIKIFGEKPTVAEASLARARKRALKNERLSNEEERKKELGPMAYYQEWVKAWKKDTSKEAVQKHFEETGEDVHTQLANMFQHQTDREYRIMVGTDLRILRDPLTMRMRPEHKRAVFGGDPVYPTINYEQDPNHTVDYRGPNFHEPLRDALDHIRQTSARSSLFKQVNNLVSNSLKHFSSAGTSSPAVPVNVGSLDCSGLGQGAKVGNISRTGSLLPWTSLSMGAAGSTPGSSQPLCRPWERADLLKRLATYKPANWSGKHKVASSLACARRGWANVDVDTIACEACNAHLSFAMSSFWTNDEAQSASEAFAEQLDTGHRGMCPWKGNSCSESLAQFPPTPPSALVGGYNDRCDALLQFSSLPMVSGSAIDRMKHCKGPQVDCLLTNLQPVTISEFSGRADNMPGAELSREEVASIYYQAQRLISLCGWEPRLVPNVVDCEEHSAQSARNALSCAPCQEQFRPSCDPGPSMLLYSRSAQLENRDISKKKISISESRCSPASAVLDCSLCGATVRICSFVTVPRPSRFLCSLNDLTETSKKFVLTRGISAASGIDGWCAFDTMERENFEGRDEAEEAATTAEGKSHPDVGMDLNLTIAGGPSPTDFGPPTLAVPLEAPIEDRNPMPRQPAGSEVGDHAASYESCGPRTRKRSMDEGGSTVDRPVGRLHHADSAEGTVVDRDADEVNDGSQYSGGPSKRTRTTESMAADRMSYFKDVSYPGPSHSAAFEREIEVEGFNRCKRSSMETSLQEGNQQRYGGQSRRDSARESSVIAMDTCYHSLQENSMESVENFPVDDDDVHGPPPSMDKNADVNEISELNFSIQAQQSTCLQPDAGRVRGETGLSSSDEGDGTLNGENATFEVRGGFSLGISGGSVGMGASHEAEIHGADVSVHRTESIVGEADLVAEVTENQGQTGEFVPDRGLMGEFVPEEAEREDIHGDSHDMMMSHSVGRAYTGSKIGGSNEGESLESGQKSSRSVGHEERDKRIPTHNAVIFGSDHDVSKEEVTDAGKGSPALNYVIPGSPCDDVNRTERQLNKGTLSKHEAGEFDPIQQHHHFCPWVNGNVAAAGCSSSGGAMPLCGWQLTLDALDVYHTQGHVAAATMESESAASLYKDDQLASVHKLLGRHSMTKNCGHS